MCPLLYTVCILGWVNSYQKFEIEKYTVCDKFILPKKMERHFFVGTTGMRICMDLRIFASFLYPTLLKICIQKFDRKYFYLSTLNFVIICIEIFFIFNMLLGVHTFQGFFKLCKKAKNT